MFTKQGNDGKRARIKGKGCLETETIVPFSFYPEDYLLREASINSTQSPCSPVSCHHRDTCLCLGKNRSNIPIDFICIFGTDLTVWVTVFDLITDEE